MQNPNPSTVAKVSLANQVELNSQKLLCIGPILTQIRDTIAALEARVAKLEHENELLKKTNEQQRVKLEEVETKALQNEEVKSEVNECTLTIEERDMLEASASAMKDSRLHVSINSIISICLNTHLINRK